MHKKLVRRIHVLAQAVRSPSDALLLLEIGIFIALLPRSIGRSDIPMFLCEMDRARRPRALTIERAYERIARLRNACFVMPRLWRHDTCYVRALTLYRFLDAGEHCMQVHVGVEQAQLHTDRLHGHAWVSIDGQFFEVPAAVHERRIREIPLRASS